MARNYTVFSVQLKKYKGSFTQYFNNFTDVEMSF